MTKRVMGRITLLQYGHAMQTKADDVLTQRQIGRLRRSLKIDFVQAGSVGKVPGQKIDKNRRFCREAIARRLNAESNDTQRTT
jgi:hypothetical protein